MPQKLAIMTLEKRLNERMIGTDMQTCRISQKVKQTWAYFGAGSMQRTEATRLRLSIETSTGVGKNNTQ